MRGPSRARPLGRGHYSRPESERRAPAALPPLPGSGHSNRPVSGPSRAWAIAVCPCDGAVTAAAGLGRLGDRPESGDLACCCRVTATWPCCCRARAEQALAIGPSRAASAGPSPSQAVRTGPSRAISSGPSQGHVNRPVSGPSRALIAGPRQGCHNRVKALLPGPSQVILTGRCQADTRPRRKGRASEKTRWRKDTRKTRERHERHAKTRWRKDTRKARERHAKGTRPRHARRAAAFPPAPRLATSQRTVVIGGARRRPRAPGARAPDVCSDAAFRCSDCSDVGI